MRDAGTQAAALVAAISSMAADKALALVAGRAADRQCRRPRVATLNRIIQALPRASLFQSFQRSLVCKKTAHHSYIC
jgi:hypothetical protein